jgi:IclR family transcriptional regulator, KDG regulon repressor
MEQKSKSVQRTSIYRVQVLERALDILDLFSYQQRKLMLTDIVAKSGLKKTTAKRLLVNLTDRGYLKIDPETKQYELGMRLFELGAVVYASFSVRKTATIHMRKMRDESGLCVLLGQCQNDRLIYLEKFEGNGEIKVATTIGQHRPLHFGMLGQILMAFLPSDKAERVLRDYPLQSFTANSITDTDAFQLRLAQIRENGFIIERGEAHQGCIGIAAPIRDSSRDVVAALGVALHIHDYKNEEQIGAYVNLVRTAAVSISSELGYLKR